MGNQTVLQMNHIMKIYGNGVVANEDVSLELRKGEIHAMLGENGAGKSTLMKILFGLVQKSSGEIRFDGSSKNKHLLGALIEAPAIYHNLSAFDNLKTKALLYDIPDSKIFETFFILCDVAGGGIIATYATS